MSTKEEMFAYLNGVCDGMKEVNKEEQQVIHAKWLGPEGKPVCSNWNVDIEKYYVNTAEDAEIWREMNYCPRCGAKMDQP